MIKDNRKGFTLVELLGVLVVLAIVLGLVSLGYVNISRHIRKTYYNGVEESILLAAGEYYTYNEVEIPKVFGEEQKVKLDKLINSQYIEKVVDQRGNECDLDASFVRVYKNEYNAIDYDVCLKCNDGYSSGECSEIFSYSIELGGTKGKRQGTNIVDTNASYTENKYINAPVILHTKTSSKMNGKNIVIYKQNDASFQKRCTVSLQSNGTYGCHVNVETSGTYIAYGEVNTNKTKEKSINVLIDEEKPIFNVIEVTNTTEKDITSNKTQSVLVSSNLTIKVNNIKDTKSGIKSIRYDIYKTGRKAQYVNGDITKDNFTITKNLEKGEYILVISVIDNAGNENKYEKKYIFKEAIDKAKLATICKNISYNGNDQVLTNDVTGLSYVNNKGKNAGDYNVTVKLDENYSWPDETTNNETIKCTIKRLNTATIGRCINPEYNGNSQTLASGGTYVTYSNNSQTNYKTDGNYAIVVTSDNNHAFSDGTISKTLECNITRKTITVTASNQSKSYDGNSLNADASCTLTGGSLVNNHNFTCTNAGSQTNAGSSTKTMTNVQIKNGNTDVTSNYIVNMRNGTLTVNKVPAIISCANKNYTGNNQLIANCNGGTIANANQTNAGSYTISCTGDANHTNATNQTCSIAKVNATCPTLTNITENYDGNAYSIGISGGSGGTIQYSTDNANWSNTNPTRNTAGTTTVYVRVLGDDNHNTVTCGSKTITINKVAATITCANKTYNGNAQTIATCSGGTVANAVQTNVGNYTISCTGDANHTNAVNQTCSIGKTAATITCANKTYNGNAQTIATCSGGTVANATQTNAGNYTISCTGDANHSNATNQTCSISKETATCPTLTNITENYDGNGHSIGVSGGSGGTIQYSTDNVNWSGTNPTRTETGATQVYVRVLGDDNHNTVTCGSSTITINDSALTYTAHVSGTRSTNTLVTGYIYASLELISGSETTTNGNITCKAEYSSSKKKYRISCKITGMKGVYSYPTSQSECEDKILSENSYVYTYYKTKDGDPYYDSDASPETATLNSNNISQYAYYYSRTCYIRAGHGPDSERNCGSRRSPLYNSDGDMHHCPGIYDGQGYCNYDEHYGCLSVGNVSSGGCACFAPTYQTRTYSADISVKYRT